MNSIQTCANSYLFSDLCNTAIQHLFSPHLLVKHAFLKQSSILTTSDTIQLTYMKHGLTKAVSVGSYQTSTSTQPIYQARNDITKIAPANTFTMLQKGKVLYLQINDMSLVGWILFYHKAFNEAKKQNAKHVIVDLRACKGGCSAWSDQLMRYIVKKPRQLRIFEEYKRNGDTNILIHTGYRTCKPVIANQSFEGTVIVLVGPYTTSSATHIVVGIKDNNLGRIIGELCGNNSFRYGEMKKLKLPNTGMEFRYSTKIYKRVNHSPKDSIQAIVPDLFCTETIDDFIKKRDPAWDCAMDLITKTYY